MKTFYLKLIFQEFLHTYKFSALSSKFDNKHLLNSFEVSKLKIVHLNIEPT